MPKMLPRRGIYIPARPVKKWCQVLGLWKDLRRFEVGGGKQQPRRQVIDERQDMFQRISKITCDKCGREVAVDPRDDDPFLSAFTVENNDIEGWERISDDVHLCPACAATYRSKLAEYEDELRRVIGVTNVSVSVTASR